MTRVEVSCTLPVGIHEGYDFISSPRNWPLYWPGLLQVKQTSDWEQPGDQIVMVQIVLGRPTELTLTLEERLPYERTIYRSTQQGLPDARHERSYQAAGDDLRYTMAIEYQQRSGATGVADRILLPRGVRRTLQESASNLQDYFAARRPLPP